MAFGDLSLDAPHKPNKGHEGGACNRQSCQVEPALYFNHGSNSWYCADCARDIGDDVVNAHHWPLDFPRLFPNRAFHPMFEMREQMTAREETTPKAPSFSNYYDERVLGIKAKSKSASLERILGRGRIKRR